MKRAALIAVLFALGGCTGSEGMRNTASHSDVRQQPSNLTPGVHVSGYATIGVTGSL